MADEFDNVPVITPDSVREMNGGASTIGNIVASGHTIEQIRSKYHTAVRVQVPRNLDEIKKRCIEEARHGGDEFGWAWPVDVPVKDENGQIKKDANGRWVTKQEIVEGRSIGLAMAAVRNWGNCTVESYVTNDLPDRYELLGVFVDFETGFTSMRPYTIRKASRDLSDKQKKKASQVARQEDMTLQIGLSKCIRNVILGAVPSWLTESMHEESKKYAEKLIAENLPASIQKAVFTFGKLGITESQLEFYLEEKIDKWSSSSVVKLRGLIQAIKDGDVKVAEVLGQVKDEQSTAPATPPQPAQTTPPPESLAVEAARGERIDYCFKALNAVAGNDAERRKSLIHDWTDGQLTTLLHLRKRPEIIDTVHAAAVAAVNAEGIEVTANTI